MRGRMPAGTMAPASPSMMTTSSSSIRDQMRTAWARLRAWKAVPPMRFEELGGGDAVADGEGRKTGVAEIVHRYRFSIREVSGLGG